MSRPLYNCFMHTHFSVTIGTIKIERTHAVDLTAQRSYVRYSTLCRMSSGKRISDS